MIKVILILNLISIYCFAAGESCFDSYRLGRIKAPDQVLSSKWVKKDDFFTSRRLDDYVADFSYRFLFDLNRLRSNDIYADFGSGKTLAAEDYLTLKVTDTPPHWSFSGLPIESRANVWAVSYKYSRWFPAYRGPKLSIIKNKMFEHIENIPEFKLGTDEYGIFSYTHHLDYYFDRTLNAMALDGKLYIYGTLFKTTIIRKDGVKTSVGQWLSEIPGLQVESLGFKVLVIQKNNKNIQIPKLEFVEEADAFDPPPIRIFREI
jgi:hypothetical protein